MSDLIKKEKAKEAVCKGCLKDWEICHHHWDCPMLTNLEMLPSADRPQGEWIKHDEERGYCSRCKHIFKTRTITKQDKWTNYIDDLGYNYCPNCGARMKGADDE